MREVGAGTFFCMKGTTRTVGIGKGMRPLSDGGGGSVFVDTKYGQSTRTGCVREIGCDELFGVVS